MCVLHASMHACARAWTYIPHMPPIPFALFLSPPPSLLIHSSQIQSPLTVSSQVKGRIFQDPELALFNILSLTSSRINIYFTLSLPFCFSSRFLF